MNLRPYQQKQIEHLRTKFSQGKKRIILCSPTGSGKTVVFTSIISKTLEKDMFNRVLVITDRIELFQQTWKSLKRFDIDPEIYNATIKPNQPVTGRVVVAMIETLKRRWKRYGSLPIGKFDLIIIDEAHKGNFKKVFDIYPDSRVIGATATPLATTKRDPLKNYYDDIVETVDIPDLIEQGYLVQENAWAMRLIDESILKKSSSTGDFTESSQYTAFSDAKVFAGLLKVYREKALGKKTIIFCPNIEMTDDVASMLIKEGHHNVHKIHSKSEGKRDEILKDFHESKSGVMVNCGILTTGYDHPPIEVCILYRATQSLPLFLQMIGRCSRTYEGKTHMTVLDLGSNIKRFGLWSEERSWTDYFKNPPKAGNPQPAPVKECPSCEAIIPARATDCNYCGYKFPIQEKELAYGELVEVLPLMGKKVSSLSAEELHRLEKQKMIKPSFAWRVARTKGSDFLKTYASISKKNSGWLYYQANQGVGFTDYTINRNFKAN
jgi:superfamily II DNA or RNA helicase